MQCCLVSGSSHTPPSVIVAKIMEKLREHERENIPPPSVVSAPVIGNSATTSPSLSTASNKFSRAARRVLTRTSVLGALPLIARYHIFHTIDFLNHNFDQIMTSLLGKRQDSSGSNITSYGLDSRRWGVQFLAGARLFSSP